MRSIQDNIASGNSVNRLTFTPLLVIAKKNMANNKQIHYFLSLFALCIFV
jgi:hypothetical protein